MNEREVNTNILNLERNSVEGDLNDLTYASGNIEGLALRLDSGDPYQFLANYARIGEIKERILRKSIPYLQTELERVNQAVEPARATVEEVTPKPKLVFLSPNEVELGGGRIELPQREYAVLVSLARKVGEVIIARDLSQEALGDPDAHRLGLGNAFRRLKGKINPKDGQSLLSNVIKGTRSGYKLEGVEVVWPEEKKEEVTAPQEVPAEPETETKPSLEINLERREIKIGDSEWIKVPDDTDWGVFMYLLENRTREVSDEERKLLAIAKPAGYTVEGAQKWAISTSLQYLTRIFKIDSVHMLIATKHRRHTGYRFNVGEVKFTPEEAQEKLGEFDVRLNDGTIIRTEGSWEVKALQRLVELNGDKTPLESLAGLLFGISDADSLRRTIGIIRKLNRLLPVGVQQITWDNGNIWLVDKLKEEQEIQPEEDQQIQEPHAGIVVDVAPVAKGVEWTDFPYEPSEEEERSHEETKILGTVVSMMLKDPFNRLRFGDLQKILYTPERNHLIGGQLYCHIYLEKDLGLLFTSGFSKIREESEAEFLSSHWSEEDKSIYENIQRLKNKMRIIDDMDFRRQVINEISRAVRLFYRENLPEAGIPLGWIKVPPEWLENERN